MVHAVVIAYKLASCVASYACSVVSVGCDIAIAIAILLTLQQQHYMESMQYIATLYRGCMYTKYELATHHFNSVARYHDLH